MMLQDLVQWTALRSPDAIALEDAGEELSYRELDRRANQLARALADLEVQPGDRVAVWLGSSNKSVVAAQAVLRLGAVLVPVDPSTGPRRAHQMLIDAGPRVLVSTDARAAEILRDELRHVTCIATDRTSRGISWHEVGSYAPEPIEGLLTAASNTAALLYPWSSSAPGKSKGVCLSHAAVLASVTWLAAELRLGASDRLLSHAPAADLLALVDQHAAFLMGAGLSLLPEPMQDSPRAIMAFLAKQGATAFSSHASSLDSEEWARLRGGSFEPRVGRILVSGDPAEPRVLQKMAAAFPGARVIGVLGAPETGLCAWYEPSESRGRERPPVGTPCAGARIWAIGRDGEEIGIGEEGEMVVQGPTVLLGYWGHASRGGVPFFTGRVVRREDERTYTFTGMRGRPFRAGRKTGSAAGGAGGIGLPSEPASGCGAPGARYRR